MPDSPLPDLDARLDSARTAGRWPSATAAVTRAGQTCTAVSGTLDGRPGGDPPAPDTAYRIGSITKTFTAVLVLRLRDEGLLSLHDPLDDHVPGTRIGHVTLAQLLTHTSGLRAEPDGPWWERSHPRTWADVIGQAELRFGAGQRFHYSNLGFGLLGGVVERLRGRPWAETLRAEILDPLEMTATGLTPRGPEAPGLAVHPQLPLLHHEPRMDGGALAPAGHLWSTVLDLARWCRFVAGDTAGVLNEDTLDEMCEPLALQPHPEGTGWSAAQGLGFSVVNRDGELFTGHTGSLPGFVSGLRVHRRTGTGAVALCNSTAGGTATLALDLAADAARTAPAPSAPLIRDVEAELRAQVGLWFWGPMEHELTVDHEPGFRLVTIGSSGSRDGRFRPVGDGTYRGCDGYFAGEPARFVTEANGVTWLEVASFCFTRAPYQPDAPVPGGLVPGPGLTPGWHSLPRDTPE